MAEQRIFPHMVTIGSTVLGIQFAWISHRSQRSDNSRIARIRESSAGFAQMADDTDCNGTFFHRRSKAPRAALRRDHRRYYGFLFYFLLRSIVIIGREVGKRSFPASSRGAGLGFNINGEGGTNGLTRPFVITTITIYRSLAIGRLSSVAVTGAYAGARYLN